MGLRGEKEVSELLSSKGWITFISAGSRGPSDISATRNGQKWCIQVKCRTVLPESGIVSQAEQCRLLRHACACGCVPIIAIVTNGLDLLRVATNVCDPTDRSIIRDLCGNFVAVRIAGMRYIFLRNLRTGKAIEP